jgi:hypothetical protein
MYGIALFTILWRFFWPWFRLGSTWFRLVSTPLSVQPGAVFTPTWPWFPALFPLAPAPGIRALELL